MLKTDKADIKDLVPNDATNMRYHPIQEEEQWKISILQELVEAKNRNLEIENFNAVEIDEMLEFLCVM